MKHISECCECIGTENKKKKQLTIFTVFLRGNVKFTPICLIMPSDIKVSDQITLFHILLLIFVSFVVVFISGFLCTFS